MFTAQKKFDEKTSNLKAQLQEARVAKEAREQARAEELEKISLEEQEDYGELKPEEIEMTIPCDTLECKEYDKRCKLIKTKCTKIIVKNGIKYVEFEIKDANTGNLKKYLIQLPEEKFNNEEFDQAEAAGLTFGGKYRKARKFSRKVRKSSRKVRKSRKARKSKKSRK
jgi:hypothetical protein